MAIRVFIHGGCVSRDAFEFEEDKNKFEIVHYSARCSLATLTFPKIKSEIDLSQLKSKFQKRLVNDDHQRNLINHLKNKNFDIFILDLNVERYDLVNIDNMGFVTNSSEFQSVLLDKNKFNLEWILSSSEQHFLKFMEGFDLLYNILIELGKEDSCFINKIYWATNKEDQSLVSADQEYILSANRKLNTLYENISLKYPKVNFIEYGQSMFIANSKHKWGISPFHYIDELYKSTIFQLNNFYKNSVTFNGVSIGRSQDSIDVDVDVDSKLFNVQIAVYLYRNDVLVQKKWYENSTHFVFKWFGEGEYGVKLFFRKENGEVLKTYTSKLVSIDF